MVAASEARTEAKLVTALSEFRVSLAELRGDLREMKASLAGKGTVIVTGIAVAGVLLAALALGSQWFGLGVDSSAIADAAADRAAKSVITTLHGGSDVSATNVAPVAAEKPKEPAGIPGKPN